MCFSSASPDPLFDAHNWWRPGCSPSCTLFPLHFSDLHVCHCVCNQPSRSCETGLFTDARRFNLGIISMFSTSNVFLCVPNKANCRTEVSKLSLCAGITLNFTWRAELNYKVTRGEGEEDYIKVCYVPRRIWQLEELEKHNSCTMRSCDWLTHLVVIIQGDFVPVFAFRLRR